MAFSYGSFAERDVIDASASRQDQLMAVRFALCARSEASVAVVVMAHRGIDRVCPTT